MCITHHPFLVSYAFYTIPILPIFKFVYLLVSLCYDYVI